MSKNGNFTVKYTTKDIMDKLELLNGKVDTVNDKLGAVHTQTKLTNGRVTSNEESLKRLRNIVYTSIGIIFSTIIGFIIVLVK